jgi:hypothetical protein
MFLWNSLTAEGYADGALFIQDKKILTLIY